MKQRLGEIRGSKWLLRRGRGSVDWPTMRKYKGKRETFHAQVGKWSRFKSKIGAMMNRQTLLLTNVLDSHGALVAEHLWIREVDEFLKNLSLENDVVSFTGVVFPYFKRKGKLHMDYTINNIEAVETWSRFDSNLEQDARFGDNLIKLKVGVLNE